MTALATPRRRHPLPPDMTAAGRAARVERLRAQEDARAAAELAARRRLRAMVAEGRKLRAEVAADAAAARARKAAGEPPPTPTRDRVVSRSAYVKQAKYVGVYARKAGDGYFALAVAGHRSRGKEDRLGPFPTAESAALARDAFLRAHGVGKSKLNFPTPEEAASSRPASIRFRADRAAKGSPKGRTPASGHRGIFLSGDRFEVNVHVGDRKRYLGKYDTLAEALAVRDDPSKYAPRPGIGGGGSHGKPPASGFRGVCAHHGRGFVARVQAGGRQVYAGHATTAEAAARLYDRKAVALLGSAARLNFPGEVANG